MAVMQRSDGRETVAAMAKNGVQLSGLAGTGLVKTPNGGGGIIMESLLREALGLWNQPGVLGDHALTAALCKKPSAATHK